MAVDEETRVTETSSSGVNPSGEVVQQTVSRVEQSAGKKTTAINAVWYVYGFISVLLGLRFIMKLFGANVGNGFVDFIYSVTGIFTAPFDSIFGVTTAEAGQTSSVFEPSILVAVAVYGLIAWGLARLFTINEKHF